MNVYSPTDKFVSDAIPIWTPVVDRFTRIWGYNSFGDLFLQDPQSNDIAILYTLNPELFPTRYNSIQTFEKEVLSNPEYAEELIQPEKTAALVDKLGPLKDAEVYIAQPYQFLGGDGSLDSYTTGNVWVYLDLIGQLQLDS